MLLSPPCLPSSLPVCHLRSFPAKFSPSDWVRATDQEVPMTQVPTTGSGRQLVRKKAMTGPGPEAVKPPVTPAAGR